MIWYVDVHAFRDGDGSQARPFRHINDAAQMAQPGDEVFVVLLVVKCESKNARQIFEEVDALVAVQSQNHLTVGAC